MSTFCTFALVFFNIFEYLTGASNILLTSCTNSSSTEGAILTLNTEQDPLVLKNHTGSRLGYVHVNLHACKFTWIFPASNEGWALEKVDQ
jgi:hypothetical protein